MMEFVSEFEVQRHCSASNPTTSGDTSQFVLAYWRIISILIGRIQDERPFKRNLG
jgi:hypothetical protein